MKKLISLFIFISVLLVGCQANQNKIILDNFYSADKQMISIVEIYPGEYQFCLEITYPESKAVVELGVEVLTENINYPSLKKQFNIEGKTDAELDFIVTEKAEYKISFEIIEKNALGGNLCLKIKNGKAYKIDPKETAYIQLDYLSQGTQSNDYEWIYGEMEVPESADAEYTNYGALVHKNARLGMNRFTKDNSIIVFVVSEESSDRGNIPELIAKGKGIQIVDQENNKTETKDYGSYSEYNWPADSTLCYLINRKKQSGNKVILSAWFKNKSETDWKYIASWKVKQNKESENISSHVKNVIPQKGFSLRQLETSNIWCKPIQGEWTELTQAQFTVTDKNNRNDYTAGIVDGNPQKFYMATGGFIPMTPPENILSIQRNNQHPIIDTTALNLFLKEVIDSKETSSWGYIPDTKIQVLSGKASASQKGERIEKSFDGDMTTIYHSPWYGTKFPVTLTYNFNGKDTIDYIIYYPRTDGTNGNFIEFELWTQSKSETNYTKVGEYNFEGSAAASPIYLPTPLKNAMSVKFVITSGIGDAGTNGFASCAEMEFYRKDGNITIPNVFTDTTCSQLKPGVTKKDIEEIVNSNYRNLANALYENNYASDYRIRNYEPYPDPSVAAKENRMGRTYSMMDNPTGIFIERDENIVVFVGNTNGQKVSIRGLNLDKDFSCTDYMLKEGLNVIKAKDRGLLYIMYHTSNPKAQPIKIHIASGEVNGYFDRTKNKNDEWWPMLDATVCKYIDVVGKYAHLTFRVNDFKKYTPDVEQLIQIYDSIVWMEKKFIGLEKHNRMNKNRMYFFVSTANYFMYATSNRTGYSPNAMRDICSPERLRTTAIWGPAHEVGHMNQTIGFKWVGMTEVSNNVYSMYIQQQFGNPSRLGTEKLNSDFDGVWFNRYEKAFTELLAGGISQIRHGDVFCKLIPFWQLQLYNSDVKGNKDFYADVHEQIRKNPIPKTDGDAILQFMKICCDVAKIDYTDFFIKWGMLIPIGETVIDHSSIQNQVYSKNSLTITQKQVDDLKKYAEKYKKPQDNIQYIHDTNEECVQTFIRQGKIKEGQIIRTNNRIETTGWENVIAFEVYDNGKLVFVTPAKTFQLPEGIKNPIIHAVPAKGDPVVIKVEN
ncbi:M60 family metallopeptidase [Bacteroidales bacterium OttesenSCG-928-M06]|nr:M60 family metallopeptidase [Bacteroidales bacterium OttesenSCG-928-M06]